MKNKVQKAFNLIHAEEGLKENTRDYLLEKINKKEKKSSIKVRRISAVLACSFLLVFSIVGSSTYFSEASAVSIDVNPSIEISINKFDRVIKVKAYSTEADEIIKNLDLKHLNYMDAIDKIMANGNMSVYIDSDSVISITVLSENKKKSNEIYNAINESKKYSNNENFHCYESNSKEMSHYAHKAGLSFGKYRAFMELQSLDPTVTIEDVKNMSMHEIQNLIIQKGSDSTHNNGNQKGNDGDHGNGGGKHQNQNHKGNHQ